MGWRCPWAWAGVGGSGRAGAPGGGVQVVVGNRGRRWQGGVSEWGADSPSPPSCLSHWLICLMRPAWEAPQGPTEKSDRMSPLYLSTAFSCSCSSWPGVLTPVDPLEGCPTPSFPCSQSLKCSLAAPCCTHSSCSPLSSSLCWSQSA